MSILVTGGAGYIGSHVCIELLNAGYEVVVVDNLCNSSRESIKRVEKITGKNIIFYKSNIMDQTVMDLIFTAEKIEAVIHLAGLKEVFESVQHPCDYYNNNVVATLNLCEVMRSHNVKQLIYSSSAAVYGRPTSVPVTEDFPVSASKPYERTKLIVEEMLRDFSVADGKWSIIILRYFNSLGAHDSGLIGEDLKGKSYSLVTSISQVATGRLDFVGVFGDDYETCDGTGIRDYIHVVDVAKGHVSALAKLNRTKGVQTYNLGTGIGYSVLEVVDAYEKACGKKIPYKILAKRPDDLVACYADASLARQELGWQANKNLEEMCQDTWKWQVNNPNGYARK